MLMLKQFVVVTTTLMLCACLPVTTKTPIGASTGFKSDAQLIGVWEEASKDQGKGYLVIMDDGDDTMTLILVNGPKDWQTFVAKTASFGGHSFLNAREILSEGKPADDDLAGQLVPVLYRVKGDRLSLSLLDEKKTATAIKKGTIQGTIDPGDDGDVRLTAGDSLDRYFSSPAGIQLFAKPAEMKRVVRP
jgi:hypothetical protein